MCHVTVIVAPGSESNVGLQPQKNVGLQESKSVMAVRRPAPAVPQLDSVTSSAAQACSGCQKASALMVSAAALHDAASVPTWQGLSLLVGITTV